MKTPTFARIILAFFLVILASACAPASTPTAAPIEPQNTEGNSALVPTLPPPLIGVDFPDQVIDYPAGWPGDLRFPQEFQPSDFSSGVFPGATQSGWSAKLRYAGSPSNASQALSAFFSNQGWQVIEQDTLDSGGFLLVVEKGTQGSGLLIVDSDSTGGTLVLTTIYFE